MSNFVQTMIVCVAMFITGMVDSIAGGGGLISIPVFLALGLPVRNVYGCNKTIAFTGAVTSAWRYKSRGFVDLRAAGFLAVMAVIGSLVGTQAVYLLPDRMLRHVLVIILPLAAVFTLVTKKSFQYTKTECGKGFGKEQIMMLALGLFIGLYDSLIGAAGAAIGMILMAVLFHYDVRTANGTLKAAFICACFTSLIIYVLNGDVIWKIAVPGALFNIAGNYIGAGFATEKGARLIRPAALIVVVGYVVKTLVVH